MRLTEAAHPAQQEAQRKQSQIPPRKRRGLVLPSLLPCGSGGGQ